MRRCWFLLILAVGLAAVALAQPPSAPPQVLIVPTDTPVAFFIWDPLDAEANEYSFLLVRLPSSGVLLGIAPEFVYIPDPGFVGTDWITYAVQDPFGRFDLAVVQIVVLPVDVEMGPPSAGLSGSLSVAGMPATLTAASMEVFYAQRFRFFDQELRAAWGLASGFTSLSARTRFELIIPGTPTVRIPIISTLLFDPTIPSLKSWTVNISARLPDVDASLAVFYDGLAPETGSSATATVRARLADIAAESTTVFGWIPVEFWSQSLKLSGPAPAFWCTDCSFRFEAVYAFTKADGFKELRLAALDLPFPCSFCEWFSIRIDLRVTYTTELKTVSPALRLVSPVRVCLRPLFLLNPSEGFGFSGIWAYGFEIRCELQGGQGLRFATSFDDSKNASVTGDSRFFEVWQAYGPILPCCGPRGRWQMSTFFKREPGNLFGWGMSDFVVFFPLDNQVLLNIGLKFGEVDPLDPTKTWLLTVGMKGLW